MFKYVKILWAMLTDESIWWRYIIVTPVIKWIPDQLYLKKRYKFKMHKELNIKNPQTFTEKLQWLKLHDRNPMYTKMADKCEVKQYIKNQLGEAYVIPMVGGPWKHFSEIDFDKLPNQFVLKNTHDSGGVVICNDKASFNKEDACKKLEYSLKHNYFYYNREWPYKNVEPRIIAEQYMEELGRGSLLDYKLHCFNGKVKVILVCLGRDDKKGMRKVFYDQNWNKLDLRRPNTSNDCDIECPAHLCKMIEFAEKLSGKIPFVRVDFYDINGKLFFGEMTFFPSGGMVGFVPEEWDDILGGYLTLPSDHYDKGAEGESKK